MDLEKTIKGRHSIRDYLAKEINHEILCEILDIAKYAPSSGNVQNWVFIVVTDKNKMQRLASACLDQDWIASAAALIVVCYDERDIKTLYPDNAEKFSIQNASTASTYIMLKATELGIGSCWVDITNKLEASNCLKLPPHITPSHLITLGYQKGPFKRTKRDDIKNITYFEEWGFTKRVRADLPALHLQKGFEKVKKKVSSLRKKK